MSGEEVLRLEGPGSLTVDVNESIQSDFVVIDGESEPEDLYNTSVFDSLSQADAVAQLKNLYVEKSDLHKKFIECSGRLQATLELLESQKKEEKSKCDKAKKRIDDLTEEKKLQSSQIDELTDKLQKSLKMSPGDNGLSPSVLVTSGSETLQRTHHTTACPSCHPSLSDSTTRPGDGSAAQLDELRKELQQAKDVHEANTKKWRKEKEELEEKISKADVKVIDISGSYETLRQHNILLENQLSGKKSEADRLSKRLSESEQRQQNGFTEINIRHTQEKSTLNSRIQSLEERLRAAESERQTLSSDKSRLEQVNAYLQSEKSKEAEQLKGENQNMVRVNTELRRQNESLLAVKQALLGKIGDCTNKMREFLPVKQENIQLKTRVNELQQLTSSWKQKADDLQQQKSASEKQITFTNQQMQTLRQTKDQELHQCRDAKDKVEKELQMIRQQLTTASQKLQEVSVQKQSSELDSNMKSRKIEDLQSQISKLEQSVGDEVPGLIQENMEQKEKIREERKKADKAGLEAAQLTEVKNKLEVELTRKTTANNQLNAKITALKQDIANREGEITRLQTQIGELNSQNIRQTVQAHQRPFLPPHQTIPEGTGAPGGPQQNTSNMIKCPMCEVIGDAEFISNHCNRDHFG